MSKKESVLPKCEARYHTESGIWHCALIRDHATRKHFTSILGKAVYWEGDDGYPAGITPGMLPHETEAAGPLRLIDIQKMGKFAEGGWITPKDDPINPNHYKVNGRETIEIVEVLDFCRGNAVKYLMRAGKKASADELEDLKKAQWYCNRAVEKLERERAAQ